MNSSYKRLGKNTVLVFIGKAGSSFVALLMLPLYTRWLSTEEFGTVDLINTYSTILLSIISCSIASAIFVVPDKKNKTECSAYYSTGLVFVGFISIFFALILGGINYTINSDVFFLNNGWNIVILTISMILINYTQQFVRAIDKMSVFSIVGIIQSVSTALLAILLIPKFQLNGYIISLVISNIISSLYAFFASNSYLYVNLRLIKRVYLLHLLKYSVPLMPNTIMWWLVNGFNRPLMESELGLSAIGLYAVALKFPNIITSVSDVFMNAFSISMIEEYRNPNFSVFFTNTFKVVYLFIIICAIGISILSKFIIGIFASQEFFEAWRILPILTLSSVFSCASSIIGGVFVARKESKYYFYTSIYGAISSVFFTIVLIKLFGLIGCATASGISFLVMYISRYIYAKKDIPNYDNKWFIYTTSLLLVVIFISLASLPILVQIVFYIIIIAVLFFVNRDILYSILRLVQNKYLK